MILNQSLRLALVGAVFGSAAALALARLMAHSMLRIDVFDAAGYGVGIAIVIIAAIAAAYVPARRAVKVDPVVTLRCD
jgi:ABC-type antimicrobial peptide transport system permease subunit